MRGNSKWWAISGFQVEANLRGVHVTVDSLSAWLRGGVAFATPESPGQSVVTGHRFVLEPEPQPEWVEWRPRIAVGHNVGTGHRLPSPIRVVASWQASWLGLYRRRTVECWGLPLDDGGLWVPASFIDQARNASQSVTIEVAGQSQDLNVADVDEHGLLARLEVPPKAQVRAWPTDQLSEHRVGDSNLLIVGAEMSEPTPLDATRVSRIPEVGLRIAPGVPLPNALEGSPVVDSATGLLIGLLVQDESGWLVSRLPRTD